MIAASLSGLACSGNETNSAASNTTLSSTATGTGGMAATSTGVGAGGNGQGGNPACMLPADCPPPDSACIVNTCTNQTCGTQVQIGLEVGPLAQGDCKHRVCDANGDIVDDADPNDPYDDGNGCTADSCNGSTPVNDPYSSGQLCAGGLCDSTATCVGCLVNAHCAGDPSKPLCRQGKCVAASCGNGMKEPTEPAVDCGEGCGLCADGSPCYDFLDCISGSCSGAPLVCQPPTCVDAARNGNETDEDCGGPDCPKCVATLKCAFPTDCESGVCIMNKCQAASCTDGVTNQGETTPDCGGPCPPPCP